MAKEAKVWEIIREAGFEPIENKSIIVSYAPANLSDAIVRFLGVSTEFFVLQICRDVPFGRLDWGLKKDAALVIPFSEIMDVEIKEAALNYHITIRTEKDVITLSAQQKELSALRSSGMLGGSLTEGNWHSENLDSTLQMLQEIAGH